MAYQSSNISNNITWTGFHKRAATRTLRETAVNTNGPTFGGQAGTDGSFKPGLKRYDLASNGVGLTDFQYTKDKIGPANIDKVKAEAEKIKSGDLKIPTTLDEEKAFLASQKK